MSGDDNDLGSSSVLGNDDDHETWEHRRDKSELECICLRLGTPSAVEKMSKKLIKDFSKSSHFSCLISTWERLFNESMDLESAYDSFTWNRVLLADHFYRFRHELLAKVFMLTLNLDYSKTDRPFSELGITSDRTPDYIIHQNETYYVLEITVSSSEERSMQSKGSEKHGFKSKYEREIKQMREKGMLAEYIVLHFNMGDPDSSDSYIEINKLKSVFTFNEIVFNDLKYIVRQMSRLTMETRKFLAPAASVLFTNDLNVNKHHDNLNFTYNKVNSPWNTNYDYKEFNVSHPVYVKINAVWSRLTNLKERFVPPEVNFLPILDLSDNKVKFVTDNYGFSHDEFYRMISKNDKLSFFTKLKIRTGGKLLSASNSTTGVHFINKVYSDYSHKYENKYLSVLVDHPRNLVTITEEEELYIFNCYNDRYNLSSYENWEPVFYDKNYEDTLIDSMCRFDALQTHNLNPETFSLPNDLPKTLASHDMEKFDIDKLTQKLTEKLLMENSFDSSIPVKALKMKPSFILPMPCVTQKDRCKLDFKPAELLMELHNKPIGEYTKTVLEKVTQVDYHFYTQAKQPSMMLTELQQKRYGVANEITALVKSVMKVDRSKTFDQKMLNSDQKKQFDYMRKDISKVSKEIHRLEKIEGITKDIGLVRLNCSRKTPLYSMFKQEMTHFKDKKMQSSIEGIGLPDTGVNVYEHLVSEFDSLQETLTSNCGENCDFLIDLNAHDDVKLLKSLKQEALEVKKDLINEIKDSYLGHASSFVSRYAHSLMFYSQLPFNNNYVRVDNLGYKNVLLIVRGGSKIFKTGSSKLHRLLFPVNETVSKHYCDNNYGRSNYQCIKLNKAFYIMTPWIVLHESVLVDSISFYPRVMSFCILNLDEKENFRQQFHKIFINVLLAFHNRRKTEEMLANLRYILLSTMGDFTAFNEIFDEFIGFNYDKVQAFLRLGIVKNYNIYFKNMSKIKSKYNSKSLFEQFNLLNVFTRRPLTSVDELALMIYSTFLMTKAPYQRPIERAKNLKGIMNIHKLFDEQIGLNLNSEEQLKKASVVNKGDYVEYSKRLLNNDFSFDPYYCTQTGVFANSYFKNHVGSDDMYSEWLSISNKPWDSMATTTGLRGDSDKDFFGQKGFFVIYDKILNDMDYTAKIKSLLSSETTDSEKSKGVSKLNLRYKDCYDSTPDTLIYHAVDKRQWRGGREIYVMDLATKRMQQPIEKFMAYLCKMTDTELISIPSDKRTQTLHHSLFEKDIPDGDLTTWFLTLDCSKWAPKSMFVKFALFIIPITCIPTSFKIHFMNYLSLLYSKRLYFNTAEINVLQKNVKEKETVEKYLISDEKVHGYYMVQPYSWVMGIFNYTSSLMHTFNQKYCSYLLKCSTLKSFNEDCFLQMFAHSDDSGGRIGVSSKQLLTRALFYYEVNLKACNHILSKKKCVVSKIYFEILSIMYMFKSLMALLPKFLGGIRFLPTDKGPCGDMLQSYSKCVEIMVAGADFSTAYLFMKLFSAEVWRFYYKNPPSDIDYQRPVQYLGMPDAHPLMVLISGSDSDIIRIMLSQDGPKKIISMIKMSKYIELFGTDDNIIKSFKVEVKIRNINKRFKSSLETFGELLNCWSLMNLNYKNTAMNSLCFLKKLSDPGFKGTLVNETDIRRMSRAYYFRSGNAFLTKFGGKKLHDLLMMVTELQLIDVSGNNNSVSFINMFGEDSYKSYLSEIEPSNEDNNTIITYFKDIYSGFYKLCNYFDKMDLNMDNSRLSTRTLKPTHIQIVKFGRGFTDNFDPAQLISYVYEPEWRWSLPNPDNLISAEQDFKSLLRHLNLKQEDLDASSALKLVRTHLNKSIKDIYVYSCIPSYIKIIKNYSGMLSFLATNSFPKLEIQGLTLNLKNPLSDNSYGKQEIDEEAYTITTQLDVLCSIGKHINLMDIMINPIPHVSYEGGDLVNYIEMLTQNIYSDTNYAYYSHYLKYIRAKHILYTGMVTGEIFDNSTYYVYLKEQKFRGSWYGQGEMLFYDNNNWIKIFIYNNYTTKSVGNIQNKLDRRFSNFISDVLQNLGIESFLETKIDESSAPSTLYIGIDAANDPAVDYKNSMRAGVPYDYTVAYPEQIIEIKRAHIDYIKENLYIATTEKTKYKVYTLNVNKTEVIPIIKTLINQDSMKRYIDTRGYEDYTDFIYQNVLVDYGAEYYISLNDLKENYNGSALYNLFTNTQINDSEFLPRKFTTAKLPAPKGSLLRMILNYQQNNNEEIIKLPKDLNPGIMAIRNEYPESFAVILQEKMQENFDKLYDNSEIMQMHNEFANACLDDNEENIRNNLIKLMCFWSYSGLVNVLQTYTFNQSVKNHVIFNLDSVRLFNLNQYSKCFNTILNAFFKAIDISLTKHAKWDYPLNNLKMGLNDIESLKRHFSLDTAYCIYDYKSPLINLPLSLIKFYNYIITFIYDPDFCAIVLKELSDTYPLNTLVISPDSLYQTICTINTLRLIWIKSNAVSRSIKIDPFKKVTRLPTDIANVSGLVNSIGVYKFSPKDVNYSGFLYDSLIKELKSEQLTLIDNNKRYVIKQEIVELTDVEIPTCKYFTFKNVLTEECMEGDIYDDLKCEMTFEPIDEESIDSLLEDLESPYEETTVYEWKNSTVVPIKWVVMPYIEGQMYLNQRVNNTAENLVILSSCLIRKFNEVRCNYVYEVNYSRSDKAVNMIAHVCTIESLPTSFWDKYIGGRRLVNFHDTVNTLKLSNFRSGNKETDIGNAGIFFGAKTEIEPKVELEAIKEVDIIGDWIKLGFSEEESIRMKAEKEDLTILYNDIDKQMDNYVSANVIDSTRANEIKIKYKRAMKSKIPGLSNNILTSFLTENELLNINKNILTGALTSEIQDTTYTKMMQSPESFGAGMYHNKPDSKSFKNFKYKAEIDSIHPNLSNLIASSTLSISTRMLKICKRHYNTWRYATEGTKYKIEMKKFFLNLYLSILNTASNNKGNDLDHLWQDINDNFALVIGEEDDEDDTDLSYHLPLSQGLRMKYKIKGAE